MKNEDLSLRRVGHVTPAEAKEYIALYDLPATKIPEYYSKQILWGGHFGRAALILAMQEPQDVSYNIGSVYAVVSANFPKPWSDNLETPRSFLVQKSKRRFGIAWQEAIKRVEDEKALNIMDGLDFAFANSPNEFKMAPEYGVVIASLAIGESAGADFAGTWQGYPLEGIKIHPFEDEEHKMAVVKKYFDQNA